MISRSIGGEHQLHALRRGHNLNLDTFSTEIIEDEMLSGSSHVVDTASDALNRTIELGSGSDDTLWTIILDIISQRNADIELVWIRIRIS